MTETRIPANEAELFAEVGFMQLEEGAHLSDMDARVLAGVFLALEGEMNRRGISITAPIA